MARSVSSPWIWPQVRDVLSADRVKNDSSASDGPAPLRPKIVQVNEASENKRYLIVSDKESLVAVFLTEEARTSLARVNNVSLNQLSHSLVKLDRWVVSTVMQCCDANARPMEKVDVKLAPVCLLCSDISYVGAEGCNIFGTPVWVNERPEAREMLSTFESTAALHERLAGGQKLRSLPDCNGQWTTPNATDGLLHTDLKDYTAMLASDREAGEKEQEQAQGQQQQQGDEEEEEGEEEDDGGGSDFGLSPDKDFQTQQETQAAKETLGESMAVEDDEETEEEDEDIGRKRRAGRPQDDEEAGKETGKRVRLLDDDEDGFEDGTVLDVGSTGDFQTQPMEINLTQTQQDLSPVYEQTQEDESTDEEEEEEEGGGRRKPPPQAADGGQEEFKESGLPKQADKPRAAGAQGPSARLQPPPLPSLSGGADGTEQPPSSRGQSSAAKASRPPLSASQARATPSTPSDPSSAGGGAAAASVSGKLVSSDKAPRPPAPTKKLFGGNTTIWHSWGFLRVPQNSSVS